MKHIFTLLLAFFALAAPASAQTFPPLTGRVVDQAHILTPAQVVDLTGKSEALETQTGRQFVIATVNSLEGYPIEDYAYRLGRAWKIGDEKRDDGVLLLVAPNDRKVWIATGYGAGAFLTDAMGCLSQCAFSSWADNEKNSTGRLADPRSFCIQKTLQEIAHAARRRAARTR